MRPQDWWPSLVEMGADHIDADLRVLQDRRVVKAINRAGEPHRAAAIPYRLDWLARQACRIAVAADRNEDTGQLIEELRLWMGPGLVGPRESDDLQRVTSTPPET